MLRTQRLPSGVTCALAAIVLGAALAATACQHGIPPGGELSTATGGVTTARDSERDVRHIVEKAGVTGLAVAILDEGRIAYAGQFGWKDKDDGTLLNDTTVFAGASLSKPVFAYLVMVLAERGVLDLDRPLHLYLARPLPQYSGYESFAGDERYRSITARMALSHTTGLPNLRSLTADGRLRLEFDPGSRFSYSGEGIRLLQMIVEHLTGADLETLAREHVFRPFGMRHTSFVCAPSLEGHVASPHNEFEWAGEPGCPTVADAAGSLVTTARDYARFVSGILAARGRRSETIDAMLTPAIHIISESMFGPGSRAEATASNPTRLAWALGWGAFEAPNGWAYFHTGHASGAQNYAVVFPDQGVGVVLLSNSDNFQSAARDIVAATIGDTLSPFRWLGFVPFDSATRRPAPRRRVAVAISPQLVALYAGTYQLGAGDARTHLRADGGRLFASDDGVSWDELLAESDSVFFFRGRDLTLTFVRSPEGTIDRIDVDTGGGRIVARRIR